MQQLPKIHPTKIKALFLLLVLGMLGLATSSQAQISVQAGVTPGQISVGDHAQLSIQIRGVSKIPQQPSIEIEGLEVQPAGTAQSVNIDGNTGKTMISIVYTYLLSSDKAGDFEIPALDLTVEGQAFKTQALKLKVVEGAAAPEEYQPILSLETGKSEVFEGEVFPLTITLKVHQNTNLTEFPFPQLPRENFAMKRFQRNPDQSIQELNGALYRVFNYRTSISAIKSGELSLGPADAKVELLVPDGTGRRDPFGGMSARQRTFKIKSNPLMIKVKPLPEAGKPANFSGAVGSFTVQIQAQPLKVVEGDPIAATIYVNGTGNFESISAPEMEKQDGWRLYPAKLVQENRNSGMEPGTIAYSQVLIPDQVQQVIPPFALAYFNPESGTYAVAKTEPIPIQVVPNPNKAAAAKTGISAPSGIRDYSFTDKSVSGESLEGILGIQRSNGPLLPLASTSVATPIPWLVHGISGSLLLGILATSIFKKQGQKQAAKVEKQAPPAKAADILKRLRGERTSLRTFYTQAGEFLTAWQRETNRPLPTESSTGEAVKRIQMRRNFYCYGANADADQPVPASEYEEILDALKQF